MLHNTTVIGGADDCSLRYAYINPGMKFLAAGFRVAAPSVMGRYGTASDKRRFSKGSMQHIKLC